MLVALASMLVGRCLQSRAASLDYLCASLFLRKEKKTQKTHFCFLQVAGIINVLNQYSEWRTVLGDNNMTLGVACQVNHNEYYENGCWTLFVTRWPGLARPPGERKIKLLAKLLLIYYKLLQ